MTQSEHVFAEYLPVRTASSPAGSGSILSGLRACGGTGRRARLRALWSVWTVGVRISLGAFPRSLHGLLRYGWPHRTAAWQRHGAQGVCSHARFSLSPARNGEQGSDTAICRPFGGWNIDWNTAFSGAGTTVSAWRCVCCTGIADNGVATAVVVAQLIRLARRTVVTDVRGPASHLRPRLRAVQPPYGT